MFKTDVQFDLVLVSFFLEACVFVEQERLPVNLSLINGSDDCFKEKKIHCLSKKVSDFFALR